LAKGLFPTACASSALLPLTFLLIYDRPDFSPTLSEEEKLNMRSKNKFGFSEQLSLMKKNRLFIATSIASALIMISNDQVHRILEILNFELYEK